MVAAEHESLRWEPHALRDVLNTPPEVCRPHSGIAAELVDLVGRGLDQDQVGVRLPLRECCFDDQRVGRAHRGDAYRVRSRRDDVQGVVHGLALPEQTARICSFRLR